MAEVFAGPVHIGDYVSCHRGMVVRRFVVSRIVEGSPRMLYGAWDGPWPADDAIVLRPAPRNLRGGEAIDRDELYARR